MPCCCAGRRLCHQTTDDQDEHRHLLAVTEDHDTGQHDLPYKDYESLDYDHCQNVVYESMLDKLTKDKWFYHKLELMRWLLTFVIGFLTAMVALFIDAIVKLLFQWKYGTVENYIYRCSSKGCLVIPLLVMVAFNSSFVFLASCLTVLEPVAAGSGIPEIKCYLNGVRVPGVVKIRTLVAKAVGVLFSVAGGLFVGKEGPMIHSGAIIGSQVPEFQCPDSKRLKINYPFFRSDRDKRDFVSGGAAAGVAAAFGAPIGGVLFSLEEGSSFWNQKLTWRTFFCSMAATFSLNFFLSGINTGEWGYFYLPGLINFGVFKCDSEQGRCHLWTAYDLLIFLVMGFFGGLLGALFNCINTALTKWRMKHVHTKHKGFRILEAVLVAMVTGTVAFIAAMTLGECRQLPHHNETMLDNVTTPDVRTYFCQDGYYNDMATLFFNPQEVAIKQLFHQEGTFSMRSLAIFFICFFILACWTYGTSVPSGLFVPSLLCGAAYGRFIATFLVHVVGYKEIYSGTYALVGAAAFLGGVVRMTISLTVILLESTNEISYGLPIMITLMVAKWSGDLFNEGLYDIHIELKSVPLLGWEAAGGIYRLRASDVMDTKLAYVYPKSRVSSIIQLLQTTRHHAFPVVQHVMTPESPAPEEEQKSDTGAHHDTTTPPGGNTGNYGSIDDQAVYEEEATEVEPSGVRFLGLILRHHLTSLLKAGACFTESEPQDVEPSPLPYSQLMEDYPRFPDIHDLDHSAFHPRLILDMSPYMNKSPYTVSPSTPVSQVFNLFRSMGLRHLPVVNSSGIVVGMITRHNLTEDFLEQMLHQQNQRRQL